MWKSKFNLIRVVYEAFFCAEKNGTKLKSFSAKKFWAFCFCALAVGNHAHLHFDPLTHWVSQLSLMAVDNVVLTALIASLDAIAVGALAVYGWSKSKGAA